MDDRRNALTCLGALTLITLVTLDICKLSWGGGILLLFYLLISALSPKQLLQSIRGDILLIISGALAIGEGLQQAGIVNFLSTTLISVAKPYGPFAVTGIIY